MNISGSKEYICERICKTYIETGRTVRSLALHYDCGKSTIGNYLFKYAKDLVSSDLYKQVRYRAKGNMEETYYFGASINRYSDEYGSMD